MTSSQLMLASIANGLEDDATAAAALDAIREESGCSLLEAVLEVARVHNATRDARDIAEAIKYLTEESAIRDDLKVYVHANAYNAPPDAFTTITVVAGDKPPCTVTARRESAWQGSLLATVTVGALWVKREASRLMLQEQRRANRPSRRRSS